MELIAVLNVTVEAANHVTQLLVLVSARLELQEPIVRKNAPRALLGSAVPNSANVKIAPRVTQHLEPVLVR